MKLICDVRSACWHHKAAATLVVAAAIVVAAAAIVVAPCITSIAVNPGPKKYATNCLNSPTRITYSFYFVCRLALNARRFHVPKLFACVEIKNFSFAFRWLRVLRGCACIRERVCERCFYLLSDAGQQRLPLATLPAPSLPSLCSFTLSCPSTFSPLLTV